MQECYLFSHVSFQNYSLSENIEKLENRCEELQRLLDEARTLLEKQQNQQRRRRERRKSSQQRSHQEATNSKSDEDEEYGFKIEESEEIEKESSSSSSTSDEELRCRLTQESGYSSSSIESHLHRLDSDSEMSSPDQHHPKKSIEQEIILDTLRTDKIEIEERLQVKFEALFAQRNRSFNLLFHSKIGQNRQNRKDRNKTTSNQKSF